MDRIEEVKNKIRMIQAERNLILSKLSSLKLKYKSLEKRRDDLEKARIIAQTIAKQTQSAVQSRVSSITSLGMNTVFDIPYNLNFEFVERRNKTEVDVSFEREGQFIPPLLCAGGGTIDVASLTLQICFLSLQKNISNPILILDEPLKHLKGSDMPERGAEMIKEVSKAMGMQIIMVSHDPTLISTADRVFVCTKRKGVSHTELPG